MSHTEEPTEPLKPSSREESGDEAVLRGVVERVTFQNAQNGYAVCKLELDDRAGLLTVVGTFPSALEGMHVVVRGRYTEHSKFGKQFVATSVTQTPPSTPDGISRFLQSGIAKGIGPKTADKLVKAFGDKTLDVLLKEPERARKLGGISKAKLEALREELVRDEAEREGLRFLMENKVPRGLATRVLKTYGSATVERVSRDPYLLARDIRGVGFLTADTIAINLGLPLISPQRLKAGLFYALERASDDGHCYLTRKQLFEQTRNLLKIGEDLELEEPLQSLAREEYVIIHEEQIALFFISRAEQAVAEFVAARCNAESAKPLKLEQVESALANAALEMGVTFSPEQQEAVRLASMRSLMVLTGGPGCGKTTVIRAIVALFKRNGRRVVLTAPTGRAAQRMSQVCDHPASTIHRLLKFDPSTNGFLHNSKLPLDLDVLIIDESSMVDIQLARDLFSAVPQGATVILVGDRDQLPSVGPGRVLGDLVTTPAVPTIALSRLYRRADGSNITSIAHAINGGIAPEIPQPDGVTKTDAYFIPRPEAGDAAALIEKLVSEQIPKKFGFKREEITVLSPTNRGELGVTTLNARLQQALNPSFDPEQEIETHQGILRVGDRVSQRVNNYQIDEYGVFNGDTGVISRVDKLRKNVIVDLWDGRLIKYDLGQLNQLSLAYCISVHRSQGSEMPCVVLALHESHFMLLERQLIYTAITRAKKLLVIVGSRRALKIAAERTGTLRRQTRLKPLIEEVICLAK
jgi:exodeoxyribonuclease V alpha subunit